MQHLTLHKNEKMKKLCYRISTSRTGLELDVHLICCEVNRIPEGGPLIFSFYFQTSVPQNQSHKASPQLLHFEVTAGFEEQERKKEKKKRLNRRRVLTKQSGRSTAHIAHKRRLLTED